MDAGGARSQTLGGRTMKARMDTKPPPPPSAPPTGGAPVAQQTRTVRRPRSPPPRRPPRPMVKEKGRGQLVEDTTESTAAQTDASGGGRQGSTPVVDGKADDDGGGGGADTSADPASRPAGDEGAVVADPKLADNGGSRTVIRLPVNRSKRRAPDVPRTRVSSQKAGARDGWRPVGQSPTTAELTSADGGQRLDTLRLRRGSLDDDVLTRGKPVVQYVQIVRKDRRVETVDEPPPSEPPSAPTPTLTASRSVDELDRLGILLDLGDIRCDYFCSQAFRSSFLEEATLKRQTIGFHSDIQTLLKHSHKDEEHIYSLPQPQSYSDSTWRAVKLITDKYDTLQRRRLHAASFREGDLAKLRGTLTLHRQLSAGDADGCAPALAEHRDAEDIVCGATGLSRRDVVRLEMFYKGRDTEVVVCPCLADLYLGNAAAPGSEPADWLLYYTGVPVWVLNTGEGQRTRDLLVYLAERETGFPLWKDKINYLTNLELSDRDPKVLTMRLSGSLSKMAKFSVFCADALAEFHKSFVAMTTDPTDELWSVSRENSRDGRRSRAKRRRKRKSFTAHDISQPCNFQHIAKLDPTDPQVLASIALLMGTNTELARGRNTSLPSSAVNQSHSSHADHLTV